MFVNPVIPVKVRIIHGKFKKKTGTIVEFKKQVRPFHARLLVKFKGEEAPQDINSRYCHTVDGPDCMVMLSNIDVEDNSEDTISDLLLALQRDTCLTMSKAEFQRRMQKLFFENGKFAGSVSVRFPNLEQGRHFVVHTDKSTVNGRVLHTCVSRTFEPLLQCFCCAADIKMGDKESIFCPSGEAVLCDSNCFTHFVNHRISGKAVGAIVCECCDQAFDEKVVMANLDAETQARVQKSIREFIAAEAFDRGKAEKTDVIDAMHKSIITRCPKCCYPFEYSEGCAQIDCQQRCRHDSSAHGLVGYSNTLSSQLKTCGARFCYYCDKIVENNDTMLDHLETCEYGPKSGYEPNDLELEVRAKKSRRLFKYLDAIKKFGSRNELSKCLEDSMMKDYPHVKQAILDNLNELPNRGVHIVNVTNIEDDSPDLVPEFTISNPSLPEIDLDDVTDLSRENQRMNPGIFDIRRLRIGTRIDCKDKLNRWYKARITEKNESGVRVHFLGFDTRWDESIGFDETDRFDRLGSRTRREEITQSSRRALSRIRRIPQDSKNKNSDNVESGTSTTFVMQWRCRRPGCPLPWNDVLCDIEDESWTKDHCSVCRWKRDAPASEQMSIEDVENEYS